MKTKLTYLLALCLVFFVCSNLQAQSTFRTSKFHQQKQSRVIDQVNEKLSPPQFIDQYKSELGLSHDDHLHLKRSLKGQKKTMHHRYKQMYKGLPVVAGTYILHERNGRVINANGNLIPGIDVNTEPSLTAEIALEIARHKMDAKRYVENQKEPLAYEAPQPYLAVVDKAFPDYSYDHRLVYVVEVYAAEPLAKNQYFVDAHNGEILHTLPLLNHVGVEGIGVSKYYGEKTIMVDSLAPGQFVMRDPSRGDGNTTYRDISPGFQEITNTTNYWDFSAIRNHEVAVDVHWGTMMFYDMMNDRFQWSGVDGQGRSLDALVNYDDGVPFFNAFWNGNYATFGDGDCHNGPLTSIDVVGHEFMHGVTQFSSGLIYRGESGALNEGMSDIFGKAAEYYFARDKFNWLLGESFSVTKYGRSFRSMENPPLHNNPDFYKGALWEDDGGVHTNSGVLNHWFYLLVEGKSGTNEAGQDFNVQSIGMDDALSVAFAIETGYLTESSGYTEAYEFSLIAAEDLFGLNSAQYLAVVEAWKAVGLPNQGSGGNDILDLALNFEFDERSYCIDGEFLPFDIIISNLGGISVDSGTNMIIDIFATTNDQFTYTLEADLMPGEEVVFTNSGYLFLDETRTYRVTGELALQDDNRRNNESFNFFFNSTNTGMDIGINFAFYNDRSCFDGSIDLELFLTNESCEPITANTPIDFVMSDLNGDEILRWTSFLNGMQPGVFFIEEKTIDLPSDVSTVNLELELTGDNNDANDQYQIFVPVLSEINGTYLNEFETPNALNDGINIDINDQRVLGVVTYNNESYLGFTGDGFDNEDLMCFEPEENFDILYYGGQLPSIDLCVDLTEMLNPILAFDLIQFSNTLDNPYPEFEDYHVMTKLSWNGATGSDSELIYGQQRGTKVKYEYKLPLDFTGEIKLEFLNQTGRSFSFNGTFEEFDYTLIDNLEIFEQPLSTEDPEFSLFSVFPNPTTETLQLKTIPGWTGQYELYSATGQQLQTGLVTETTTLLVSDLADGIYFVRFVDDQQQEAVVRFVKL